MYVCVRVHNSALYNTRATFAATINRLMPHAALQYTNSLSFHLPLAMGALSTACRRKESVHNSFSLEIFRQRKIIFLTLLRVAHLVDCVLHVKHMPQNTYEHNYLSVM